MEKETLIRTRGIELKWREIGKAILLLSLSFGAGFLALALLRRIPGYVHIAQNSPWIPKYIGDSLAFAVAMLIIWLLSKGRLQDYGFTLARRNLKIKISITLGLILGFIGILLEHFPELISGAKIEPAHLYALTVVNVLGMMSFQWIFVGIFEETITRGLVQAPLLKRLKGIVKIFKWDFHIGTLITAIIFGVGHLGPHMFFSGSLLGIAPHILFATLYGLCSGYIYQETKSLAGPILIHNIVDGLIFSIDYFFY